MTQDRPATADLAQIGHVTPRNKCTALDLEAPLVILQSRSLALLMSVGVLLGQLTGVSCRVMWKFDCFFLSLILLNSAVLLAILFLQF